jgi:hypothetical protein
MYSEMACENFEFLDGQWSETCYIMYGVDPCNMWDYTCTRPHYDMNGDWQYTDCSEGLTDYNTWMVMRESPAWHNEELNPQLPYIHEFWDNYHGVWDPYWWSDESYMYEGEDYWYEYDDYDYFFEYCDVNEQDCNWIDCEAHESMWETDCWKELCYGCDMEVCQLWHWNEDSGDWDTEDCDAAMYYEEDDSWMDVSDVAMTASAFNGSLVEAQENFCGNFSCMEMLGNWTAQLLMGNSTGNDTMWGNDTMGNDTMWWDESTRVADENFFGNEAAKDVADQVALDAEEAFDVDMDVVEWALEADSVNNFENAAEHYAEYAAADTMQQME